jgi:thiol-disulfide isomerase/thioredoxin
MSLAIAIIKEIKKALSEVTDLHIRMLTSIRVGNEMPDVVDADRVSEEGMTTVKHEKGQVILYDFGATWCGPYQQLMVHNY